MSDEKRIERFEQHMDHGLIPLSSGGWVRYSDHEAVTQKLEARIKEMERANEAGIARRVEGKKLLERAEKAEEKCDHLRRFIERGDLFNRCLEIEADRDKAEAALAEARAEEGQARGAKHNEGAYRKRGQDLKAATEAGAAQALEDAAALLTATPSTDRVDDGSGSEASASDQAVSRCGECDARLASAHLAACPGGPGMVSRADCPTQPAVPVPQEADRAELERQARASGEAPEGAAKTADAILRERDRRQKVASQSDHPPKNDHDGAESVPSEASEDWPEELLMGRLEDSDVLWQAKPGAAAESGPGAQYRRYVLAPELSQGEGER